MTRSKRNWYITIASVGTVAVFGLLFVLNSNRIFHIIGVSKTVPVFSFDAAKAPGWWATENYNSRASTTAEEYQGDEPIDKLPVASMNIFKGKQGEYKTDCFVMFSYYDYPADIAKLKAEKNTDTSQGDMKFQDVGDVQSSIRTPDGVKPYISTKYELTGSDAESAMKGMSYGWVDLGDSYISVSGVYPTASELNGTLSVVNSVTLARR